jgi:hypothetical protein
MNIIVYDIVLLMTEADERVPLKSAGIITVFIDNINKSDIVSNIPDRFCAPGKRVEVLEKVYFGEC